MIVRSSFNAFSTPADQIESVIEIYAQGGDKNLTLTLLINLISLILQQMKTKFLDCLINPKIFFLKVA